MLNILSVLFPFATHFNAQCAPHSFYSLQHWLGIPAIQDCLRTLCLHASHDTMTEQDTHMTSTKQSRYVYPNRAGERGIKPVQGRGHIRQARSRVRVD